MIELSDEDWEKARKYFKANPSAKFMKEGTAVPFIRTGFYGICATFCFENENYIQTPNNPKTGKASSYSYSLVLRVDGDDLYSILRNSGVTELPKVQIKIDEGIIPPSRSPKIS